MKSFVEISLTVLIACAAVGVIASAAVAFRGSNPPDERLARDAEYFDDWHRLAEIGTNVGGHQDAAVTLVVIGDLECPACRGFHSELIEIVDRRAADMKVLYVPFPLDYHRFAHPAARGGECAAELGYFREWLDAVYAKQDSLGLKSWESYATDAGIAEAGYIEECAIRADVTDRLQRAMSLGRELGLTGIPTVIMQGWRFPLAPGKEQLEMALDAILAGQSPHIGPAAPYAPAR